MIRIFAVLSLLCVSCDCPPSNSRRVIERLNHAYIWEHGKGYVHDSQCPACKEYEKCLKDGKYERIVINVYLPICFLLECN